MTFNSSRLAMPANHIMPQDEQYLLQLGARVRDTRARLSMSRKTLAADSGVSERYLAQLEGGLLLNIGSAVILPEVFLKALTIARNLGHTVEHITTANFDMQRHYRPTDNVVKRPTHKGGQGYYVIGHHELLVPLWAAAVIEQLP